jgi:hypothetical protein
MALSGAPFSFAINPTPKQKESSPSTKPKARTFLNSTDPQLYLRTYNSTMSGYDSYYSQGYQNQNQNQYSCYNQPASTSYSSSSYPSDCFSGSGSGSQFNPYQTQQPYYYQDNRAPHDQYDGSNNSYYNNSSSQPTPTPLPGQEADRGMMGAMAGGAAGAFGGHKAGHGFLGSIGGAIIGSLAEDYAKKNEKNKNKPHHHKAGGSHSNSNSMMGGGGSLGSTASSFFNRKN